MSTDSTPNAGAPAESGNTGKRREGRPTKLTPEVQEKMLVAIRGGNYREVAAEWAGISAETFAHWMARGKKAKSGIFHEFFQSVIEAEQHAEINMVRLVANGANTDPKHAEWWLERKHHDRWGRKDTVLLNLQRKSDDELRAIVEAAVGTDGGGDPGTEAAGEADPAAAPPEPDQPASD